VWISVRVVSCHAVPPQDLLAVQLWTSLVLFLGMVETGAQYFDYR